MTEPRKNLPYWLIASLVLNGLLLGLIGGQLLGQKRHGPPAGSADRHLAQNMTRIVDPAERAQLRAAFRGAYESTRAEREEVRRLRGELAGLIAAESYDEAQVREAFSRLREAETAAKAGLYGIQSRRGAGRGCVGPVPRTDDDLSTQAQTSILFMPDLKRFQLST